MRNAIYFMMFLILVSISYASIDAYYECTKKSCIEGSMMNWTIVVGNNIDKDITIGYVTVVEMGTNKRIAFYDVEGNVTLSPDESHVYEFQQLIPAPSEGYTFYYRPCFKAYVEDGEDGLVCKEAQKSLSVLPKSKVECEGSDECATDEYCETVYTHKCKSLNCSSDQAIQNHECVEVVGFSNVRPIYFVLLGVVIVAIVMVVSFTLALKPKKKPAKKKKKGKKKKR